MEPTMLRREVLPPRHAPFTPHDFVSEDHVRDAIMRAIWTASALVGLANVATCMIETWL